MKQIINLEVAESNAKFQAGSRCIQSYAETTNQKTQAIAEILSMWRQLRLSFCV